MAPRPRRLLLGVLTLAIPLVDAASAVGAGAASEVSAVLAESLTAAEEAACAAGGAEECEEVDLLQQVARQRRPRLHHGRANSGGLAVTFQGGGFKAQSCYVGALSALLANTSSGSVADLFDKVTAFSSVSGGSWFMSMVAYSPQVLALLERMANMGPAAAGTLYYNKVLWPFIESLDVNGTSPQVPKSAFESLESILRDLANDDLSEQDARWVTDVLEVLSELRFALYDPNWPEFVAKILKNGGQLDPTTPLGSRVNSWAEGRDWLIGTALPTIGGNGLGSCANVGFNLDSLCEIYSASTVSIASDFTAGTSYHADWGSASKQPIFVPGHFSVQMGKGMDQDASIPFCSESMCGPIKLVYHSTSPASVESAPLDAFEEYTRGVGSLPLVGPVAASSAFVGMFSFLRRHDSEVEDVLNFVTDALQVFGLSDKEAADMRKFVNDLLGLDLDVWTYSDGGSTSDIFKEGLSKRTALNEANDVAASKEVLQDLAQGRFKALIDGGYVDGSGVSGAVAAGHTRILAFVQSVSSLWRLFSGFESTTSAINILGFNSCPLCFPNVPLFADQYGEAKAKFEAGAVVVKPTDAKTLKSVSVGVLTATTVESEYWGVAAGQRVEILIVGFDTDLSIGGFSYESYGDVVGEIMSALHTQPGGKEATAQIFDFLGAALRDNR